MFWYGDHASGWGWALMSIGMVLVWGLVITGIVLLIRSVASSRNQPSQTPEQLLAERFARGEIDQDEYFRRLDALDGKVPSR